MEKGIVAKQISRELGLDGGHQVPSFLRRETSLMSEKPYAVSKFIIPPVDIKTEEKKKNKNRKDPYILRNIDGQKLRNTIQKSEYTETDLCEMLGMCRDYVSAICRTGQARKGIFFALCRILEVDEGDFLIEETIPDEHTERKDESVAGDLGDCVSSIDIRLKEIKALMLKQNDLLERLLEKWD